MNNALQYLAHLVNVKNSLNRRRRRFYAITNTVKEYYWTNAEGVKLKHPESHNWDKGDRLHKELRKHKAFTAEYAMEMYKQTQEEMKAMTEEMRRARKEANARLVWNSSGGIDRIEHNGYDYYRDDIEHLAEFYAVDSILLK